MRSVCCSFFFLLRLRALSLSDLNLERQPAGSAKEETASFRNYPLLYSAHSISVFFWKEKEGGTRKEKKWKEKKSMTTAARSNRPPPPSPPSPFRFGARRDRIDWGAMHGVDVERMVCWLVFLRVCVFDEASTSNPQFFFCSPSRALSLPSSLFLLPRRRPQRTSMPSKSASPRWPTVTSTPSPVESFLR